jgi:tyrosine-protein kinase Etk/Wzc
MNKSMVQFIPYTEVSSEVKDINVGDSIKKYLYHWPLFASAIILCLACAFLYIEYAKRVYDVKAQLLFKNEDNSDGHRESALEELDIVPSNKVVENEMEILKSRILMTNVVNELRLWIAYKKIGFLKTQDLYTHKPVQLTLIKSYGEIGGEKINIRIKDDRKFVLLKDTKQSELLFPSILKTKSGVWKLDKTKNLKHFIGETINISINNNDSVAASILTNFHTEVISKQATVVEMSLRETIPERGRDILNRLIEVYNLAAVQDKNRVTESTLKFIDERLAAVTSELNNVEKEVERFKSSKGLTDISSQSKFYLENVTTNDSKLNEVNVEIQVLEGIEKYINSPATGRPPATVGITDPALVTLINQLIGLEFQRERLLANTPEGNPMFDPINRQLASTRQSIKDIIQGIKSSLISTRKQLQTYDSRFVSSIKDLPGQERQYLVMQRQHGIKEELYIYLLKKREEAALSYASTLSNSRIVESAFYGSPISPNIPLTYALALLFGLVLPASFIYGREVLNNKVRKEVSSTTSVPLLGELVYQEGPNVIVMHERNCRIIAEQFRSLRTNLKFLNGNGENSRVIMLTSGMSGEGKSFITCNLGAALSASGRKTIILELDMRKPTISKYFHQNGAPGLSNFLNGTADKEEIVQSVEGYPNLFIISAGELPSNPSEILEEPRINQLIEWLRLNYDEILIDTPPVQLVTDGMIISKHCDIHLYVIRQGVTYKSHLEYLKQLYQDKKLDNLHVIFNGVDMKGRHSYNRNVDYAYYSDEPQKRLALSSSIKYLVRRF